MKFTLNEKYTLIENDRRFILAEADEDKNKELLDSLQAVITELKNTFSSVLHTSSDFAANALKQLDQLETELKNIPETNDKKTKITQFGAALKTELSNIFTDWSNRFPEIAKGIQKAEQGNLNYIKKVLTDANAMAEKAKLSDEAKAAIEKVIQACDSYKDITADKLNLDLVKSGISQLQFLIKYVKKNQKDIVDSCQKVLGILEKFKKVTIPARNGTSLARVDWDALFKEAGTDGLKRAKLWDGDPTAGNAVLKQGYYITEWGKNAELIKSLGQAFIYELTSYGYDARTNPFIAYLQQAIRLGLPLNTAVYSVIHNAVVNMLLSLKDLRGSGIFGENNIIFCKNFFEVSATAAKEYLYQQSLLAARYQNGTTDKLITDTLAELYANNPKALQTAIFYANGQVNADNASKNKSGDRTQALKSSRGVRLDFVTCFGAGEAEFQHKKLAFNVDYLTLKSKADFIQAILFLQTRFMTTETKPAFDTLLNNYTELKNVDFDSHRLADFLNMFRTFDINTKNVLKCIEALIEKGQIK